MEGTSELTSLCSHPLVFHLSASLWFSAGEVDSSLSLWITAVSLTTPGNTESLVSCLSTLRLYLVFSLVFSFLLLLFFSLLSYNSSTSSVVHWIAFCLHSHLCLPFNKDGDWSPPPAAYRIKEVDVDWFFKENDPKSSLCLGPKSPLTYFVLKCKGI